MPGLTKQTILDISQNKKEPSWMRDFRLKAWEKYQKMAAPAWGPNLSKLDLNKINYSSGAQASPSRTWKNVPPKTKEVFEKLGIPQAERKILAGIGTQWDSEIVYQNLKEEMGGLGIIFCSMDEAVQKYPQLIKKYFMTKCLAAENNKFAALHAAVWSGGVFIYVPKGLKVNLPLQGYFWLNMNQGGQFEHTIIVADEGSGIHYIEGCSAPTYNSNSLHIGVVEIFVSRNARVRFSTVQNWSKNIYNLGMKRAIVEKNGIMEWVSGSLGSKVSMVYPASVLVGEGAKAEHLSLSFAGKNQELDTGGKVIHLAPHTTSNIISKSVCQDGGRAAYRGLVKILKGAAGAKANVTCHSLILDNKSHAKTYPAIEIAENDVTVLHEAKTGKIAEEELFYLMSRGLNEQEAMSLIINGFTDPIVKELPLEYAVEINRLIDMEIGDNT